MNQIMKEKIINEIKKGADRAITNIQDNVGVSNPPLPSEVKEKLIDEIIKGRDCAIKNVNNEQ